MPRCAAWPSLRWRSLPAPAPGARRPTPRRSPTSAPRSPRSPATSRGCGASSPPPGALSQGVAGNTPLERLDAIEAELQRLTSKSEELEFRINRIVTDGTNRLGDLEFRVCELEEGCDIGALGDAPSLGGVDNAAVVPVPADAGADARGRRRPPAPTSPSTSRPTSSGRRGRSPSGDFRGAADLFAAFVAAYPGSPLTARAQLGRGEALDGLGETWRRGARLPRRLLGRARRAPSRPTRSLGLGRNLGQLGQVPDACITLAEIANRFPASPLVARRRRPSGGRWRCP